MAMQSQGEIKKLAETVLPDIAVITNSGQAHLKQLGSEKNIAKAKSEIFCRLKKNSFAVLNADDKFFGLMKANVRNGKLITFGIKNKADIAARDIKEDRNNIIFEISAGNKKRILSSLCRGLTIFITLCRLRLSGTAPACQENRSAKAFPASGCQARGWR
jgi:UDP-N-acetylmuramyl pentapeptide synthase